MIAQEAFEKTRTRILKLDTSSGISFLDALDASIECLFLKLWERRSDIVKEKFSLVPTAGFPFTFPMTLGGTDMAFPSAFRGLAEDPYLVTSEGSTITLVPMPINGDVDLEGTTGDPQYYEIFGNVLYITPSPTTETYTIKGKYFARPTALEMEDTLPWNGLFDFLICEAVIEATRVGGLIGLLANQAFMATLVQAMSDILPSRANPAPRRVKADY